MLRFVGCALLLICVVPSAYAQKAGEVCELGDSTQLHDTKDSKKVSAKLPKGSLLTLKELEGEWRLVETAEGVMGFVKSSWLRKSCTFTAATDDSSQSGSQDPGSVNAGTIAEAAAAMELTRVAAEDPTAIHRDLVKTQSNVLSSARASRAASRQNECASDVVGETYRVAVYDFELENIPEGMGKMITSSLLAEVRKLEGASVIGMDEIREMINFEAQRQAMGCEADEACMAQIAGALGVDEIITGRLTEGSDGRNLLIRRIDQRRAEVVGTVDKRLAIGNGEEFLLAIGPAVEELYPNRPNRPGTTRGVPKKMLLRLNPPPIAPMTTLATIGVSVTALAVGGAFAILGQNEVNHYNTGAGQENGFYTGQGLAPFQDSQRKAESYVLVGNVGLIAGGVLALTSTVMTFFTDWALLGDGVDVEE